MPTIGDVFLQLDVIRHNAEQVSIALTPLDDDNYACIEVDGERYRVVPSQLVADLGRAVQKAISTLDLATRQLAVRDAEALRQENPPPTNEQPEGGGAGGLGGAAPRDETGTDAAG